MQITDQCLCDYSPPFHWELVWVLKVPYYEKHVFSGLYIYKLVLPEPANSQNEESRRFLCGLCSPPTGKTELKQAVQIQRLLLCNERSHFHRPTSSDDRRYPRGGRSSPRWSVQRWDSSVSQCHHSELDTLIAQLLVVKINTSAYILSKRQNNRRESGCLSFLKTTYQLWFMSVCLCVLTTLHRTASVTRVTITVTVLVMPRHWPL